MAAHDNAARGKPRSSGQALAGRVDIVEVARFELEHRSVVRRTPLQGSEIAPARRFRRPSPPAQCSRAAGLVLRQHYRPIPDRRAARMLSVDLR